MTSSIPNPPFVPPPPPSYEETMKTNVSRKNSYGTTSTEQPINAEIPVGSNAPPPTAGTIPIYRVELEFDDHPTRLQCPYCDQFIVTVTHREVGCLAYMVSALLCIVGCWPCALLPCCISDMLDISHTCPNCNKLLGTHKRIEL